MAAPNIFYLTGLPWVQCTAYGGPPGRVNAWLHEICNTGLPLVTVPFYEGEDLMSDFGIFFCSKRLREALYPLKGAFFMGVRVLRDVETAPGTWLPVTFYEIAVEEYFDGLDLSAKAGLGALADDAPECEWESWRPRAKEWTGEDIFMMNDQLKLWHGPLVTESFLKRIQGFNLGDEFKAEPVRWG